MSRSERLGQWQGAALLAWAGLVLVAAYPVAARLSGERPWWGVAALLGHAVVHAVALAGLGLLGVVLLSRVRGGKAVGLTLVALGVLGVAIDARVFGLMGMHLGRESLEQLRQPRALTTLGLETFDLLEVAALFGLVLALGAVASRRLPPLRWLLPVAGAALAVDGVLTLGEVVARFKGLEAVSGLNAALPFQWRPRGEKVLARLLHEAPQRAFADYEFFEPEPFPPERFVLAKLPLPTRAERRPDVLLVLVETLRADALAAAPNLSRFMAENVSSAHHASGGNCTFLGVFTALSGLSPAYWGAGETWRAPSGLSALASLGYEVRVRDSSMLDHHLLERVLEKGVGTRLPSVKTVPTQRDDETVALVEEWVSEARSAPSVLVVFLESPHWPYALNDGSPKPSDFTALGPRAAEYRARYLRSVAEADARLGQLFAAIAKSPRAESLVVAVAGDHGEAFLEHGVFMHGRRLDDEQVLVPLALRLPGVAPQQVPGPTVNQDILPTVLAYLGAAEGAALAGQGVDLLGAARQVAPLVGSCGLDRTLGYAVLDGPRKLLLQLDRNGAEYLGRVEPGDVRVNDLTVDARLQALLDAQAAAATALLVQGR